MVYTMRKMLLVLSLATAARLWAVPVELAAPKQARNLLVSAAESYRGTPYRYGGLASTGVDCSGLVYLSFRKALGISVPRTARRQYDWADPVARSALQPGDLVFFNTEGPISHVGIYIGDGRFVHAASEGAVTGVTVADLNEPYWRRAYAGGGRVLPAENLLGVTVSLSAAPSWAFPGETDPFQGLAFAAGASVNLTVLGLSFSPGIEARAEWDRTLGVIRVPFTVSFGLGRDFRVFAGPALSFGDATMQTSLGTRNYYADGGFFGALGVAWAPLSFRMGDGKLSLFGEAAWQTYTRTAGLEPDWAADMAANLRLSTGLRYSWGI